MLKPQEKVIAKPGKALFSLWLVQFCVSFAAD
jgi:hypothetical protein